MGEPFHEKNMLNSIFPAGCARTPLVGLQVRSPVLVPHLPQVLDTMIQQQEKLRSGVVTVGMPEIKEEDGLCAS